MANRINVILGLDISALERSINRTQKQLDRLGNSLKQAGATLTQSLTLPILGAGAAAVSVAAKYETLQTSLSTLLGSAEAGAEAFRRLSQFAARTPFQLEDVAAGAKQLLAFGLNIDQVYDSLSFLGDIAGATGSNLQDLTLIFGQARSIGAAYTEDLRQLAERGVPVFDLLSKKTGLTGDALRKFIEQGKVTFPLLQELLKSTAQEGGLFFGGMEAQSRTLAGVFSTFKDNVQLALAQIGNAIADAIDLRAVMAKLSAAVQSAADWFGNLNPRVQKAIVFIGLAVAAIGPILFALGSLAKVSALAVVGFKSLLIATKATAIFFASGLLNPITLVVGAIAALVAGVLYAYSRFEGFRRIINGLGAAIKEIIKIFREAGAAFFEGFANLKEGDFKKANENFKKAFTAGIPTEFARQYGKRVKDAFGEGFADDTDFVKKGLADLRKAIAGATGIAGAGEGVAPITPIDDDPVITDTGGSGKKKSKIVAELTERTRGYNEALLESFARSKGLESSLLAIKVLSGEIDPDQIKFDGATESAKLFKSEIESTFERIKRLATPVQITVRKIGEALAESMQKAIDFVQANVVPVIDSIGAVFAQGFSNRQAAIDSFYESEKTRIENSRLTEEQKAAAIAKLDNETDKRRRKLARDQAIRDKAFGLISAVINVAQGVTKALSQGSIPLAAIIGALGAVQIGLIAGQKIPALATGGITTGPTLALIGDNPSGREAVIPFEKMGQFLDMAGAGRAIRVTGLFEVKGSDLILVLDRAKQDQIRIR